MVKVLGVDPSTRSTGFAIISGNANKQTALQDYGCLKLSGEMRDRVGLFFTFFLDKVKSNDINLMAIEVPFLGKNISTYGKLCLLKGVLYTISYICDIEIIELYPSKVKQMVTFKGNATKKDIASVLRKRYKGLPEKLNDDITDAIGVAYSGIIEKSYAKIVRGCNAKKENKKKSRG